MKTLKTLPAIVLTTVSLAIMAATGPDGQKLTMDYALKAYIDAVTQGKVKSLSEVLDSDVKFTVTRGEKIINYTRSEMLNALRATENLVQNCATDHSVVEQNTAQSIVKVSMKYEGFTRINYVTMVHTDKGWKITSVSSAFV